MNNLMIEEEWLELQKKQTISSAMEQNNICRMIDTTFVEIMKINLNTSLRMKIILQYYSAALQEIQKVDLFKSQYNKENLIVALYSIVVRFPNNQEQNPVNQPYLRGVITYIWLKKYQQDYKQVIELKKKQMKHTKMHKNNKKLQSYTQQQQNQEQIQSEQYSEQNQVNQPNIQEVNQQQQQQQKPQIKQTQQQNQDQTSTDQAKFNDINTKQQFQKQQQLQTKQDKEIQHKQKQNIAKTNSIEIENDTDIEIQNAVSELKGDALQFWKKIEKLETGDEVRKYTKIKKNKYVKEQQNTKYFKDMQIAIEKYQRDILIYFGFDLETYTTEEYINKFLENKEFLPKDEESQEKFIETVQSYQNDVYRSFQCLYFEPEMLALTIIYGSYSHMSIDFSNLKKENLYWYQIFDQNQQLSEIEKAHQYFDNFRDLLKQGSNQNKNNLDNKHKISPYFMGQSQTMIIQINKSTIT